MTLDEALQSLAERARRERVLVALDFDGVLAPFVDDPADSRPLPDAAAALERIAATSVDLALVSGRALADLAERSTPPDGTLLIGGHGAERGIWRSGTLDREELRLSASQARRLGGLTGRLTSLVAGTTARVETKPASVVLHTRTASPDDAPWLTAAALALGTRPGVDVIEGKNVVELSVLHATKGTALEQLRTELGVGGLLFAGDDVTDERAFNALRPDDVTVKVGAGETAARWRVTDPAEMAVTLMRLADLLD
jgi:trehalose-phosphatase